MRGGITFDYPWALAGFGVFIPLILFEIFSARGKNLKRYLSSDLRLRLGVSGIFFKIFLACFIIALAGPRWGRDRALSEYRRGLDAVFALDVSASMEVRDVPAYAQETGEVPRLERGLAIARETVAALPGARFAAAVSRGRGLVTVPLTWDSEAVLSFLEVLDSSSLTGRGTNLESLVDAAASAFQSSFPSRRAIILISDGEALSGSLRLALDRISADDISVIALAMGSDEGGPVPERTPAPEVLSNSSGAAGEEEPVISRRDSAVLRMAAERSGGIYIDGSRKDAAILLMDQLRSLAPETETRGSGRREQKPRWFVFIAAALLAYGVSKISSLKMGNKKAHLVLLILLVSHSSFFTSCTPVSGKLLIMEANFLASRGLYTEAAASYLKALEYEEAEPYAEYGLGSVYYSLDEAKAALDRFGDSQKILENRSPGEHRELRYRNHYNRGVVLFGEGNFSGAAEAFKEALKTDPGRIEAKRNLELSLLSLAREHTGEGQAEPEQKESESRRALFEYLRQKEQNQWKSREWGAEEQDAGPDY